MMKKLIIALSLLLLTSEAHAFATWSNEDRALFATELVLSAVDVWQTSQFHKYGIKEANPIFKGSLGNPAQLAAVMAAIHVIEYFVLDNYPETRALLPFQVTLHLGVVVWIRQLLQAEGGVKIPF